MFVSDRLSISDINDTDDMEETIVCGMGYVIMGKGIQLRDIQRRRIRELYPKASKLYK